jgi:tripartite-type tricarboxylate transporter receptor subunit TctC
MKRFLLLVLTVTASFTGLAFAQADYPAKPIRMIVGFSPGGANDIIARMLGAKMQDAWGQSVVIDNRPGANSNIATEIAANAPPDGYTLLFNASGMVINPAMYESLAFDTIRDFEPISQVATFPFVLAVNPSVPARTVTELIAVAKSQPGKLNYGAGAAAFRFAAELFKQQVGIDLYHIPYKGSVQAINAVLANDIQITIVDSLPAIPHLKSGRLRGLAVTSGKRASGLPDIPTMIEAGVADYDITGWAGLFAPAGTPKPIVNKLNQQTARIVQMPDFREKLLALGSEPVGGSAEDLATIMKVQSQKWKTVNRTAHIKAE